MFVGAGGYHCCCCTFVLKRSNFILDAVVPYLAEYELRFWLGFEFDHYLKLMRDGTLYGDDLTLYAICQDKKVDVALLQRLVIHYVRINHPTTGLTLQNCHHIQLAISEPQYIQ